jgi:catalase-peroxidase
MVPMAHSDGRREPRMLTTDISLRVDPAYGKISRKFKDDKRL